MSVFPEVAAAPRIDVPFITSLPGGLEGNFPSPRHNSVISWLAASTDTSIDLTFAASRTVMS